MAAHKQLTYLREGSAVVCEGAIDERADLSKLIEHARDGVLVLDLAGITFINSLGVRAWCQLQQLARSIDVRLELRRVSERLVHQLNIVPAARAASTVTSFFGPYVCDRCGLDQHVLIDVAADGRELARGLPPAKTCQDCRAPLVFGELPELYFAFLLG